MSCVEVTGAKVKYDDISTTGMKAKYANTAAINTFEHKSQNALLM